MEEQISTTPEASVEQTTPVVAEETQTTEQTDVQPVENAQPSEPETTPEAEGTETVEQPKDWEKIAKDNQASFTKVSQELAELKKKYQPQVIDEKGKITPEYRQQYQLDVDNQEFLAYDQIARRLDNDQRLEVENLLEEAKSLYNPMNKRAYEEKMAQVKDYFSSSIVEQIAINKRAYEGQIENKFNELVNQDKQQRATAIAEQVEALPDLKALIYQESENYSQPVMDIVKQMFDLTGGVDLELTNNAIKSIKELGVKEYLANQKFQTEKAKAIVPTGDTVQQNVDSGLPTREQLLNDASLYQKCVRKGIKEEDLDRIIMKG